MIWAFVLLVLAPLTDSGSADPFYLFRQARYQFSHGHLAEAQLEAKRGRFRFASDSLWASRFALLEAESMVWGGTYDSALLLLENVYPVINSDDALSKLTLQGIALTRTRRLSQADARISEGERLCTSNELPSCGGVLRARGLLSLEADDLPRARVILLKSLDFARSHHDKELEGTALQNLGSVSLQEEHIDEAVDWITSGYRVASELGDENLIQVSLGNLGWAYFRLGDVDRALELTLEAEKRAASLGNIRLQINWVTTAANVYQAKQDWQNATDFYQKALTLASKLKLQRYTVNALEDLTHASIDASRLDKAEDCVRQLEPLVNASEDRLDFLDVELAKARIASAKHRWSDAEKLFQTVDNDPASQTSMRMGAEHGLARLYESSGDVASADRMYRTALSTFESARDQLKNEESKLPFLANATSIYDDYIHFLVGQKKSNEALHVADQSRAQTLAQGLQISSVGRFRSLRPNEVARQTGATLLFYWLGQKQSYLWAITAAQTSFYTLPGDRELGRSIKRYRSALQGLGDAVENANTDGLDLYRLLVQPASSSIKPNANVIILADGPLSQLNFETLIVPAPDPHYWIEDVTISSAPSLQMLASSHTGRQAQGKLLLIGDAISPGPDYPNLPMASAEMQHIQQKVGASNAVLYSREQATPAAYLTVAPQQFAYIHFVAHGVASSTDPLDSAIILSRASTAEDSFKLHARDIIQHPIRANLVTISACYGSGARSFAGEGSIGLAWAFLRAGAHNVIGALWEVSDDSTSRMMGDLYQGLGEGQSPSAALRQAKLALLHSKDEFRKPFYWAPLQIYTGL